MISVRRLTLPALLLALAHAQAATIVVGPTEKIRSVGEALKQARAGDIVQIRQGVYVERLLAPDVGVEDAALTIRAAPGERVVIDAHGAEYGFQIARGAGWVVVEGLIVVRARHSGFYARPAHDLTVRECTFARNGAVGLYAREIDGMTVEGCRFHRNRVNGASFRGVRRLRVSDCMAYLHPAAPGSSENFGIYVSGIEGGVFERNALFLNDKSGLRIVESPRGNLVRDNVTYLNGWTGFDLNSRSHKHLYVNNLVIRNMVHGINPKGHSRENRFVNNTVVGAGWCTIQVNNRALDNVFRSNILAGSPAGFSYDTRIGWDHRDSDYNVFDCARPVAQLDNMRTAHSLGLERHSLVQPVKFATADPFDFRLPEDSPLHAAAVDAGFGKVMGAPRPSWRGPRLLPVPLNVIRSSGDTEKAKLTADGSVRTTWNSGVTENAWVEYEVLGDLPGPLAFAIICPTVSTRLPDGDLPGPFTLCAVDGRRQVLYDGQLFIRQSGLARARGQCFELTRRTRPRRVRIELHNAVDGNYNGRIENICLTEVMLIAALDPLPESLAEFPYDAVAPVSTAALEAARSARRRPTASVPDAVGARDEDLLLYVPFEEPARAAYARGRAEIFIDGAEYLPGIAGKGVYLSTLPGNVCSVPWPGNLNPDAGTFSVFIKPLVAWDRRTVGQQNFQFIMVARPHPKAELRLAYVGGGFQVVGGVAYNGPPDHRIHSPVELKAHRWHHVCLTWSKQADATVLYLDGSEIGRARFSAEFAGTQKRGHDPFSSGFHAGAEIRIGCNTSTLQPMAVLDEIRILGKAVAVEHVEKLAAPYASDLHKGLPDKSRHE